MYKGTRKTLPGLIFPELEGDMIEKNHPMKRHAGRLVWLSILFLLPAMAFSKPVVSSGDQQTGSASPPTGQGRTIISGTVQDPTGALLVGAKVMLDDQQKKSFTTMTDQEGAFSFKEEPPRQLYIKVLNGTRKPVTIIFHQRWSGGPTTATGLAQVLDGQVSHD
jgi:hypothetical protein